MVDLGWDQIIILFSGNALFDTILGIAVVAFFAGAASKKRLVAWLTSHESSPFKMEIAGMARAQVIEALSDPETQSRVFPKAPVVPPFPTIPDYSEKFSALDAKLGDLPDFEALKSSINQDMEGLKSRMEDRLASFNDKASNLGARLDLTDQKLATAINDALKKEMPTLFNDLSFRMNQQIVAAFARQANEAEATLKKMGQEVSSSDPQTRLMIRAATAALGKKGGEAVGMIRDYMESEKMKKMGGAPGGQGGPPVGAIIPHQGSPTGYLTLSPTGQWIPWSPPGQQAAYPGYGPAPLGPGGPMVPTPGAGAPPGYLPYGQAPPQLAPGASITAPTPPGVAPPLPPPPKEVDRRATEVLEADEITEPVPGVPDGAQ